MRDLTIEDPTDQLQRLRDVHDVKACLNLPRVDSESSNGGG